MLANIYTEFSRILHHVTKLLTSQTFLNNDTVFSVLQKNPHQGPKIVVLSQPALHHTRENITKVRLEYIIWGNSVCPGVGPLTQDSLSKWG